MREQQAIWEGDISCLAESACGSMALIGNLARLERRVLFVELDALLLIVVYLAGVYWLYARGIGR